jgi:hypothetical protein
VEGTVIVSADGEEAKLVGLRHGEAVEEDAFGEGEDDGVGSDAEGERGDSHGGEAGSTAKHANGVAEVGAKLVEKTKAERLADVLFVGLGGAELDAGAAKGFSGSEAGALEVFGAELDVRPEFGFDVRLDGAAMEEGVEIGAKLGLHDGTPLYLFRCGVENARHERGHAIPVVGFGAELTAARGGEAVELGLAFVVGLSPLGGDKALMLQAEERGIERALLNGELIAGDLLDAQEDTVAVERAEGDRLQDEHVEGPLHEVELVRQWLLLEILGEL